MPDQNQSAQAQHGPKYNNLSFLSRECNLSTRSSDCQWGDSWQHSGPLTDQTKTFQSITKTLLKFLIGLFLSALSWWAQHKTEPGQTSFFHRPPQVPVLLHDLSIPITPNRNICAKWNASQNFIVFLQSIFFSRLIELSRNDLSVFKTHCVPLSSCLLFWAALNQF